MVPCCYLCEEHLPRIPWVVYHHLHWLSAVGVGDSFSDSSLTSSKTFLSGFRILVEAAGVEGRSLFHFAESFWGKEPRKLLAWDDAGGKMEIYREILMFMLLQWSQIRFYSLEVCCGNECMRTIPVCSNWVKSHDGMSTFNWELRYFQLSYLESPKLSGHITPEAQL